MFRESGASDEQEFRRRAVEAARVGVLQQEREALDREITAAIAGHCPQQAIRQQLEGDPSAAPESRRDELRLRSEAAEKELRQHLETRGRLAEQLKSLADDRRLAHKQLDLAIVEKRLDDALRHWQMLAVTCRILESIRNTYEQQRQPETLQEASGYLERLTQGRYSRVWTPLGQRVLRVDDAAGHSLPVEALSRGTREQLFLSLRLALAACYARRGAPLPLVLDDVLVNFDSQRAKAAAVVLRDFAAAGHQVLVFTCHEHILQMFKSLRVPTGRLPDNMGAEPATIVFEEPAREKAKRRTSPAARQPSPASTPGVVVVPRTEEDEEAEADDWDADQQAYDGGDNAAAA